MTTPTIEDIRNAAYSSLETCRESWPELVDSTNIGQFIISERKKTSSFCSYKEFSNSGHETLRKVTEKYGDQAIRPFLRIVLLKTIIDLIESQELQKYPEIITRYQQQHLHRIAVNHDTSAEWLDISHDLFHKEFGLASLRLLTAGCQVIDINCGIPRSIIIRSGILKAPGLAIAFAKLGGFKPYFQLHTHLFNLEQFNAYGSEECYRGCAALYDLYPDCLGMFRSSWFIDPAIEEISPRLSYLRQTPQNAGAIIAYYSTDEGAKANALSTSPTRRALYEQGKYIPKSYMLVWGKADQIAWAKKNPAK